MNIPKLTTKAIIAMLNPAELEDLFYELELIVQPANNSIQKKLKSLQDKYFHLVWLARRLPEDFKIPSIQKTYEEMLVKYPNDVDELECSEDGWVHGFNSGMLACVRLLAAYALPRNHREVDRLGPEYQMDDNHFSDNEEDGRVSTDEDKEISIEASQTPLVESITLPIEPKEEPSFPIGDPVLFRLSGVRLPRFILTESLPTSENQHLFNGELPDDIDADDEESFDGFPYEPVVTKAIEIYRAEKQFPFLSI